MLVNIQKWGTSIWTSSHLTTHKELKVLWEIAEVILLSLNVHMHTHLSVHTHTFMSRDEWLHAKAIPFLPCGWHWQTARQCELNMTVLLLPAGLCLLDTTCWRNCLDTARVLPWHKHKHIQSRTHSIPIQTWGVKLQANEATVSGLPLPLWAVWGVCLRAIKMHSHLTAKSSSLLKRTPLCACWHSRGLYGAGSLFSVCVCWQCGSIAGPVHYSLGICWHWGALLRCIHYFSLETVRTSLLEDPHILPEEKGVYINS